MCTCRSLAAYALPPLLPAGMWVLPYIHAGSTAHWIVSNVAFAYVTFIVFALLVDALLRWQKETHWFWYGFMTFLVVQFTFMVLKLNQLKGLQDYYYMGVKVISNSSMTLDGLQLFIRECFGLGLVYAACMLLFWCLKKDNRS